MKQGDPELVFELAYLLTQRRLGDVQPLCRATEVKLLRDSDEVCDKPQIEPIHRLSLLIGSQEVLDFSGLRPQYPLRSTARCHNKGRSVSTEIQRAGVRPTLPMAAARGMVDAALAHATMLEVPVTVVAVDESGVVKAMVRMDGAPLVSVETATSKAYAAAAIGMPTDEFYSAIESDAAALVEFGSRQGLALIAGGLPILVEGRVAGAIGVAGAMTAADDRRIAQSAIAPSAV